MSEARDPLPLDAMRPSPEAPDSSRLRAGARWADRWTRAMDDLRPAGLAVTSREAACAHGALIVAQAIGLLIFVLPWKRIRGFPLDDAWIHQVVARTFAETGTLGYTPGQHGAGATSYLWASLLAVNFRWLHLDPIVFTDALNVLLYVATGQLFLRMLLRGAEPRGGALAVKATVIASVAAFGGNFVWFAFSGMEALLFSFLSLGAIASFTYAGPRRRAMAFACGASVGALALARPEAASLGLVLLAVAWLFRRPLAEAALIALPWAAALALYVGSNLLKAGTAVPATLEGRRWLWLDSFAGDTYDFILKDFVAIWAYRLREYTLGTSSNLAFWLCFGFAAYGACTIGRWKNLALSLTAAWAAIHLATYAVIMPSPGHAGRYQPLVPFFFLALATMGATALIESLTSRWIRGARARRVALLLAPFAGAAPWAGLATVGVIDWHDDEAAAVTHIANTEIGLARVINDLPSGARVASFDIGASGFFSSRPVLDLGALTDRRALGYLKTGRLWEYLRDDQIQYLILPLGYGDFPDITNFGYRLHLVGNPHIELAPVATLISPLEVWVPSNRSTWNAAPRQVVYQVTYAGPLRAPLDLHLAGKSRILDPESLLSRRARGELEHTAGVLERAGAPVDLAVSGAEPVAEIGGESAWQIRVGRWGSRVTLPPGLTEDLAGAANTKVADFTRAFVDGGDLAGAAGAALYEVMLLTREYVAPDFFPMLPPVKVPAPPVPESSPESTLAWGLPLAAMIVAVAAALGRRERSPKRGAPEPAR